MSAATTLAELKSDLRANGIDYDGMTFFEGTSKVELKNDASVLPHDVPYKGIVTNELVFMLTNTNKKIRSGAMSRTEAYNAIKSMGLQSACVKKFGKNFTMCKTADLIALVQDSGALKSAPKAEAKAETKDEERVEVPDRTNNKRKRKEIPNQSTNKSRNCTRRSKRDHRELHKSSRERSENEPKIHAKEYRTNGGTNKRSKNRERTTIKNHRGTDRTSSINNCTNGMIS